MAWGAGEPFSIENIEVAPPRAHEVRIQILHTGVCHTGALCLVLGILVIRRVRRFAINSRLAMADVTRAII